MIYAEDQSTVVELHAEYDPSKSTKPKVVKESIYIIHNLNICSVTYINSHQGVIHWVAEPSNGVTPFKVEVRLFDKLFLSEVTYFSPFQ